MQINGTEIVFYEDEYAYTHIARRQREGARCAFVDYDMRFNPLKARLLGVDVGSLSVKVPNTSSEATTLIDELSQQTDMGLIVVSGNMPLPTPQKPYPSW